MAHGSGTQDFGIEASRAGGAWSDEENDLVVASYFRMLDEDAAGRRYSKTAYRRALQTQLKNRSAGSIEFKHQNISAVLKGLGEDWIPGYKPAFNFQRSLIDAVIRWLEKNPSWLHRLPCASPERELGEEALLWVGPAPTQSNQPPPRELEQTLQMARAFDVAVRDERNRALGRAGEERVLAYERARLCAAGRPHLAHQVRWISEEDGDGAGYDEVEGSPRLIEVKTTNGWERTPFYITRNELAVAEARRGQWCLFRVWNFARAPRAFKLYPPLDAQLSLTAMTFEASFKNSSAG